MILSADEKSGKIEEEKVGTEKWKRIDLEGNEEVMDREEVIEVLKGYYKEPELCMDELELVVTPYAEYRKIKEKQQVWIRRIDRPDLGAFATGDFVKEIDEKIYLRDYEKDEIFWYDKDVFERFIPKGVKPT